MFKRNKIVNPHVKISISREVLESIFDECDKYDRDETGGRIIGYYKHNGINLDINVCGAISSGSKARRSPTSFFQDGEYQETVFRKIEVEYPDIEHLGNWHTHHVNGLDTLSSGDVATYTRIVNHEKHNTDFFYALLVVSKAPSFRSRERYVVKHFFFKRGEPLAYEIPSSQIKIVNDPPLFVDKEKAGKENAIPDSFSQKESVVNKIRSTDREIIPAMYPNLKPFFSKGTNSLYWKGKLALIDNTSVELLMLESIDTGTPLYTITLTGSRSGHFQCKQLYLERDFDSGWKAIFSFERDLNREIFEIVKNSINPNLERDSE